MGRESAESIRPDFASGLKIRMVGGRGGMDVVDDWRTGGCWCW